MQKSLHVVSSYSTISITLGGKLSQWIKKLNYYGKKGAKFLILLRNSLVTQKNGKYLLTFCNNYLHIICNMNYDDMEELKKKKCFAVYLRG